MVAAAWREREEAARVRREGAGHLIGGETGREKVEEGPWQGITLAFSSLLTVRRREKGGVGWASRDMGQSWATSAR